MLFIFRKLRRSFFLPGKVRTYSAYAAGEIILIVVGILLALQISEWNQGREDRAEEIGLLSRIFVGLNNDVIRLEDEITKARERTQKLEELLEHVQNEGAYNQSLNDKFTQLGWVTGIEINRAPFEDLKSRGFRLVNNQDLLLKLTHFYENEYAFIMRRMSNMSEGSMERILPFTQKHFHWGGEPLDYEQLIKNPEFLYILNSRTDLNRIVVLPGLERVLYRAEELSKALRAELAGRGITGEE